MVAATGASKVTRLEEAMELLEEEVVVGRWKVFNLFAGISMMSSKLCFLFACDAGMMPTGLGGYTTGGGGGKRGGEGKRGGGGKRGGEGKRGGGARGGGGCGVSS